MARPSVKEFRRAGTPDPEPATPVVQRWYGKLGLLLLSVLLLSFAFAPYHQFYLAWVGLVPWLIVVIRTNKARWAFLWSWLGGTLFFIANMWWLANVTVPGMIALLVYLGLFWGFAALILRGVLAPVSKRVDVPNTSRYYAKVAARVLLAAVVWCGLEWLRGNYSMLGNEGLPWLYLGYSQSPVLAMCQVADLIGVAGVSFWLVFVNVWVALWGLQRFRLAMHLVPALMMVVGIVVVVLGYGIFRLTQNTRYPGPIVMVVQPNYPQDNSGNKGATQEEMNRFHFDTTRRALDAEKAAGRTVDLVVWSETMMRPLNLEARQVYVAHNDQDLVIVHENLGSMAWDYRCSILVGATYAGAWRTGASGRIEPADVRNSAFFYNSQGVLSDDRYDKVHLVPFGEFIPFRESLPPLYRMLINLGPPNMEDYQLTRGDRDHLAVFDLQRLPPHQPADDAHATTWRFVTPICFEDIDGDLIARMFRPGADGAKRADIIVNITNDGWFAFNEPPQHLQAAVFRSIEVRAPTARSVNTGISGFIDSDGRIGATVPQNTEGVGMATLMLDSRITVFSRIGELFAKVCAFATSVVALQAMVRFFVQTVARRTAMAGEPDAGNRR